MAKLWSGRFEKNTAAITDAINFSIGVDGRMYSQDITGSIAHAAMLGKQGIITQADSDAITAGLREILSNWETQQIPPEAEDIHMAVEAILTAKIGEAGKRLHTARSRNDQVALDFRLYLKEQIVELRTLALNLLEVLCKKARENLDAVMPAYTHLQRAQPSTFAHYLMAYAQMFRRDCGRLSDCLERMDESPLGAGALCGTTYPIDREFVASELGFARITENSLDAVSDRDFALELLSDLSILQMHLSRFAEEIVLWCSWEFKFLELDDAFATGSSMMPQKKNPDVAELVRGKTGRVYGDLATLLTVMKGLPLAYNKDMQEDKEAVFDALDTVWLTVTAFTEMLGSVKVLPDNMRAAASKGFINATDCADYLVTQSIPFRDAHEITGKLVRYCIANAKTLDTLTLDEYKSFSGKFDDDIFSAISLETCIERRGVPGGPSKAQVQKQIESVERFVGYK
ncbi:MAG: argininosuccinate lyase [Oscillospiraceae bacterium]|jgi:argininosuccinate lyase|nr:argininosuccinate lyase [Oscillospiraceae bacterium]